MAKLHIDTPGGSVQRPLATSTLLGRHRACTWRLEEERVPLYWLELRWVGSWAWRVLAGEEHTRGPGRALPGGWRKMRAGDRIRGPGDTAVTLAEAGPPAPFVVDAETLVALPDAELDDVVEWRADGAWPVGAEAEPDRREPLGEAQLFRVGQRFLRFHAGTPPAETVRGVTSLDSPHCELALDVSDGVWTLTITDGPRSAELAAEYVRVLLPYVEVRCNDMPPGGWLELDAAHFRWQQLGGSADSGRERIAQDRSRLTRQLGKLGVAAAAKLFETRRGPEGWVTRVHLPPEQLHADIPPPPPA